jgi:hypothetical protein
MWHKIYCETTEWVFVKECFPNIDPMKWCWRPPYKSETCGCVVEFMDEEDANIFVEYLNNVA